MCCLRSNLITECQTHLSDVCIVHATESLSIATKRNTIHGGNWLKNEFIDL